MFPYLVLAASPHLLSYSIGIGSFHLLDLFLLILLISNLHKINQISYPIAGFFLVLIICFFLHLLFDVNNNIGFLPQLRYFYYLIFSILIVPIFKSSEKMNRAYEIIVNIAVYFLFLQWIVILSTGIYIPGYLPGLELMREELQTFSEQAILTDWFRPRSIFNEPSNFGLFVGSFFFIRSFKSKKISLGDLFIALSLIVSFSTTGFLLLIMSIIFRSIEGLKKIKFNTIINSISFLFIITIFILMMDLDENVFGRIEQAMLGRIDGYSDLFKYFNDSNLTRLIIGAGFGFKVSEVWLPSILNIFIYYGFLGLLSFLFLLTQFLYKNESVKSKAYVFIILIASFFTELALNSVLIMFIFLVTTNKYEDASKVEKGVKT